MKILVVSDVHANLPALDAILADCGTVDAVWNLGDTVGYGPNPRECIERMAELGASPALVGNHDLACIGRLDLADFNPVARTAAEWTARQLNPDHRRYLEGLPSTIVAGDVTLAHGSPRHPVWEYVTDEVTATANFAVLRTPNCLIGHSHVALVAWLPKGKETAQLSLLAAGQTLDLRAGRLMINPGSVGQPRDRDPRAAYALLDLDAGTLTAHRVAYDVAATQRQMRAAGLPEPLISRLSTGM